jgi:poly-gamma-glutamate capsule biosynthesis protein CapA/YwtB (metallophosphatase superfamily)
VVRVWRLEAGLLLAVLAVAIAGGFDGPDRGSLASGSPVEDRVIPSAGVPALRASTTTDAPTARRRASLLFSGDVLAHEAVQRQANAYGGPGVYDFGPMFAEVAPIVSAADLAICHMETPLSADSTDLGSYPIFNSPGELGTAIAEAGYDGCSLASNHSYDKGAAGVRSTVAVMERNGLGFAGMARNKAEHETPRLYDVNGISIAHLSYTFNLNGKVLPDAEPYLANVIDQAAILAEAQRARAAGADFVVLSMHWGNDYQQSPNAQQLELADVLLPDPDVDLIIGHHAHVAQPWVRRGDEIVVFGLGNSLSNQSASCCAASTQDGVMARLQIEEQSDGGFLVVDASYVATWVDRSDYTIVPVAEALASGDRSDQADALRTSQARTASAVNSLGADAWGVRPADIE